MEGSDLNGLLGQLLCHLSCFYDVYSHQVLRLKRSSPNPLKAETTESRDLYVRFVSNSSTDLFPSAEMHFRCLSKRAKTNTRERINFDMTQGKFIRSPKRILPMNIKKTFMKTHRVSLFSSCCCLSFYALHMIKIKRHVYTRRSVMSLLAWCLTALCIERVELCI